MYAGVVFALAVIGAVVVGNFRQPAQSPGVLASPAGPASPSEPRKGGNDGTCTPGSFEWRARGGASTSISCSPARPR